MLHTLCVTPRTKPYSSSLRDNLLYDRLNDFQPKPRAVLDGPAVCVCAVVTDLLQRLVYEETVCAVDLDAVEACAVYCVGGCRGVVVHVLLDFCDSSALCKNQESVRVQMRTHRR